MTGVARISIILVGMMEYHLFWLMGGPNVGVQTGMKSQPDSEFINSIRRSLRSGSHTHTGSISYGASCRESVSPEPSTFVAEAQ